MNGVRAAYRRMQKTSIRSWSSTVGQARQLASEETDLEDHLTRSMNQSQRQQQQEEPILWTSKSKLGSMALPRTNEKLMDISGVSQEMRRQASLNGLTPSEIIVKKRDGSTLTAAEIDWFISGFHHGFVEPYQMSAFLMAVCTRGMTNQEAADMTKAVVKSGKISDLSAIRPGCPKVDKHSSGGTGDKVSLILTPLVACFDVVVPMIAGRSIGHTGGTLDKIASIPGVQTDLSTKHYMDMLSHVGCAIAAPTEDLCPVEKRIYELRDVSGCIEDVALVASSVMSKKVAEGPDALLLDVKMGRGAFAKCLSDAAALASAMVAIGHEAGINTCCLLTNMNAPLGSAVGNSLEVREAMHVLKGRHAGPVAPEDGSNAALADVRYLALAEASVMLGLAGKASSFAQGFEMASEMLDSGKAMDKFAEMITAQGGDASVLYNLDETMPKSSNSMMFRAPEDVIIQDIDAYKIGTASAKLGAGRMYLTDPVDYDAGIILHAKIGEVVRAGDPIITAFVGDEQDSRVEVLGDPKLRLQDGFSRAIAGVTFAPNRIENQVAAPPLIDYFIDSQQGMTAFKNIG